MTYFFETYGCEMNIAESASVEQLLLSRGWTKAFSAQVADLAIINTCSVRETAENRIMGRLGWFSGLKAVREKKLGAKTKLLEEAVEYVKDGAKPLTLVVMGCMAERLLKDFQKNYPFVDYVVGTYAKHHFGEIIEAIEEGRKPFEIDDTNEYKFASVSAEPGAFSTFVPIMHGCNNFCTYCIVPYVRGREVSRPEEQIISEIDFLSGRGVKEITLLGQNVNAYKSPVSGKDGEYVDFPDLLKHICIHLEKTNSPIRWIRFESSNPNDFSDKLIQVIKEQPRICNGFHIAAQHGNTEILRRMNRKNTREEFLDLVKKLRKELPGVQLVTDLMTGFPGETEEQFNDILSLMEEVKFESAFMYYYNPREGTPAATFPDQIDLKIKKERLQKIINLQLKHTTEVMEKRIGETITVLADIVSRDDERELLGKTEQNERVAFKADKNLIGSFVKVRLTALNGNTFKGELVQ